MQEIQNLAYAVISQAARDYRQAYRITHKSNEIHGTRGIYTRQSDYKKIFNDLCNSWVSMVVNPDFLRKIERKIENEEADRISKKRNK